MMTSKELAKRSAQLVGEYLREYGTVVHPVLHIAAGDEVHVYYVHPSYFGNRHGAMDFAARASELLTKHDGHAMSVSLEVTWEVENDLGYLTTDTMAYVMAHETNGDMVRLVSAIQDLNGVRVNGPWREATEHPVELQEFGAVR